MASLLTTIYATIAAQSITIGATAVGCLDLAQLRSGMESAVLPTRMLVPFNARGDGSLQSFWTLGDGVRTVDWGIADILFWRAAAAGVGLDDIAPDLIAYKVQYAELLKALRGPRWNVIGCQLQVQAFEWPLGSGRWWDGVIGQLTIREIVQ